MRLFLSVLLLALVCGCICQPQQAGQDEIPAANEAVCPTPYILVGSECCLDRDGNGICDRDETTTTERVTATIPAEETSTTQKTTTTEPPTTTAPPATTNPTTTTSAPTTTAAPTTSTATTTLPTTTTLPLPCTDSDGGNVQNVKGTVVRGTDVLTDRCQGTATLVEFFCTAANRTSSQILQCPQGCVDGRCGGCADTDGGDKPDVYGEVTLGTTLTKKDICSKIGDGKTLTEFICVNSTDIGSRQVYCDAGCADGKCH